MKAPTMSINLASEMPLFTSIMNAGGPFLGPNGSTNQHTSSSGVQHPSFSTLGGATGIYQKPLLRSIFDHTRNFPILFTMSLM